VSVDFRGSQRLPVVIGGMVIGEFVGYQLAHAEDAFEEDGRTTLHLDVYADHEQLATLMQTLAKRYRAETSEDGCDARPIEPAPGQVWWWRDGSGGGRQFEVTRVSAHPDDAGKTCLWHVRAGGALVWVPLDECEFVRESF
jgi:hypothetical protein